MQVVNGEKLRSKEGLWYPTCKADTLSSLGIIYPVFLYLYETIAITMFGEKIKLIREIRGFSQENVAAKLGIAQNSYSRIETNQAKLDSAMLVKLADVLGVSPMDILSGQPAIINFQSNKGTQQSFGYVENVTTGQKELYDKLIAGKDEEIARLNKIIEKLLAKK